MTQRTSRGIALLLVLCVYAQASDIPKGLEIIFKNVEKGKPYHPYWPPLLGDNLVGSIVIASKPGKPEAMFETIESPDFRNPHFTGQFQVNSYAIQGGEFGKTSSIGVDVSFSNLDSMANGMKQGPKSSSFVANGTAATAGSTGAASQSGNPGSSKQPQSGAPNASGGATTTSSTDQTPAVDDKQRTVTGVDFSRFSKATVSIPKLHVSYYTLETLRAMEDTSLNGALSKNGRDTLSDIGKGWIVSRSLIADSMTYELTSDSAVDGGFFVKLLAWLPTATIRYKNATTISITTTSPVVLGYKLWRPGSGIQSSSVTNDNLANLSEDSSAIDHILDAK
jgi:hypothetical protein